MTSYTVGHERPIRVADPHTARTYFVEFVADRVAVATAFIILSEKRCNKGRFAG